MIRSTAAAGAPARRTVSIAVLLLAGPGASITGPSALAAQDPGIAGPADTLGGAATVERPAKWSVQLELGTRLPGVLYDNWVQRRLATEDTLVRSAIRTRYTEENDVGFDARLTLNLFPESSTSAYLALLYGSANTTARFAGGIERADTLFRSMSYRGVEFGINMRLKEWAAGRGIFGYNVGATFLRHEIDLGGGHRDAFARVSSEQELAELDFDWSERSYGSWGLSIGSTIRIPVSDGIAARLNFRDLVVPVNTSTLGVQEQEEVRELTGEGPTFTYSSYTAHHLSLDLGFEYTFSWGRPDPRVERRIPTREEEREIPAAVANAMRVASNGDTARAVEILEHQVSIFPENGAAWRELSLLLAARAEIDPSVRQRALDAIRRAINLNPGDAEVLRAFGRVRGLLNRAGPGAVPEEAETPLSLSDIGVEVGEGGDVQMTWAVRGLAGRAEAEGYDFRYEIDILTAEGESVQIRPYGGDLRLTSGGTLMASAEAEELPVAVRANLFLLEPDPGLYTARVRVIDLATGASTVHTGSFEIE